MIAMVVDGQPRACIVVSDSASLVERHAAAELTKYICLDERGAASGGNHS